MRDVLVVVGAGDMGTAIAARLGSGRVVLLADRDEDRLLRAAQALTSGGVDVVTQAVDVTDADSLSALAARATSLGAVRHLVHTAGVSPEQASVATILAVDLLGVARTLEAFGDVMAEGGSAVVLASLAGHFGLHPISTDEAATLGSLPADELLTLPFVADRIGDPQSAYGFAKEANRFRVRATAVAWGRRGVRLNSISPGIICTGMGQQELSGPFGETIKQMIDTSPVGRIGTPYDVAELAAFLLGPSSSYITGTDVLVDGGVLAAALTGATP